MREPEKNIIIVIIIREFFHLGDSGRGILYGTCLVCMCVRARFYYYIIYV